jgi:hypothetical protein
MRRRISCEFPLVVACRNHYAIDEDHGTDRNVTVRERISGLFQGQAHSVGVGKWSGGFGGDAPL